MCKSLVKRVVASLFCALVGLPIFAADRIVAVGDIHGSFDGLTAILQEVGLIDEDRHWSGGSSIFVQTGDYLDRGEGIREVLDFLMELGEQADRGGGKVIVLLGNHETMNILRLTRDVSPNIYPTFATKDSDKRRADGLRRYLESLENRIIEAEGTSPPSDSDREAWLASHPPGYIEYLDAFGPDSRYGKWLRERPVAARVGKVAFMHAGANPQVATWQSIKDLNKQVAKELEDFDSAYKFLRDKKLVSEGSDLMDVMSGSTAALERFFTLAASRNQRDLDVRWPAKQMRRLRSMQDIDQWTIIQPEKALWFRGLATWEDSATESLEALLDRMDAQCIVAGHSVITPPEIRARFDNRVFLIDTGMLASHYRGGRPSALVFEDDKIVAHYVGDSVVLSDDLGRCR